GPVDVDGPRINVRVQAVRVDELAEQAELVPVPEVNILAVADQLAGVIDGAEPRVDLVHRPEPRLAAQRQEPVVADVDSLERVEEVVLRVVRLVEVAEVEIEAERLGEGENAPRRLGSLLLVI